MAEIEQRVTELGKELGVNVWVSLAANSLCYTETLICRVCAQTNHEGVFIDLIHYSRCLAGILMK
jgi:hypothetical protein